MVYQFRCSCQESRHFQLEIEAGSGHSFFDLHRAIQASLGFQPLHLASFFLPAGKGRRQVEISQLGHDKTKSCCRNMKKTMIGDMLIPGIKIIRYVFDFLNDRYIQLELTGTVMEKNLREPVVKLNRGKSPVQVLDEVMTDGLFEPPKGKSKDPHYGVLDDYYEIFGEMEEYVV
jgi:hypothetical protein